MVRVSEKSWPGSGEKGEKGEHSPLYQGSFLYRLKLVFSYLEKFSFSPLHISGPYFKVHLRILEFIYSFNCQQKVTAINPMPTGVLNLGYDKRRDFTQVNNLQTRETEPLVETDNVLCQNK